MHELVFSSLLTNFVQELTCMVYCAKTKEGKNTEIKFANIPTSLTSHSRRPTKTNMKSEISVSKAFFFPTSFHTNLFLQQTWSVTWGGDHFKTGYDNHLSRGAPLRIDPLWFSPGGRRRRECDQLQGREIWTSLTQEKISHR